MLVQYFLLSGLCDNQLESMTGVFKCQISLFECISVDLCNLIVIGLDCKIIQFLMIRHLVYEKKNRTQLSKLRFTWIFIKTCAHRNSFSK